MSEWKPIESAPLGKKILLFHPGSKYLDAGPVIGHMEHMSVLGDIPIIGCTIYGKGDATHWMPLPEAPRPLCKLCGLEDGACICRWLRPSPPQTVSVNAAEGTSKD